MLTREEFQTIYDQGPDAVFALLTLQQQRIGALEETVQQLQQRLDKASHNSHKPPSSDGLKKPPPKSLRKPSGRKPGGQKGHPGKTLRFCDTPDETIPHIPVCCCGCGASLEQAEIVDLERRQVHDLPPLRLIVTEHVVQTRRCACGKLTTAAFPEEASQPIQYGPRLKALCVYLRDYQLLPFARSQQLLSDLFGASLSTSTLCAFTTESAKRLKPISEAIQKALIGSALVHFDETGMRVAGKLHWVHSAGTHTLTHYTCHANRGKTGSDAAGILPKFSGIAVHDAWCSYAQYGCSHALCNAHHLRELIGLCDQGQTWAKQMLELLLAIKACVEQAKQQGKSRLPVLQPIHFEGRYQAILKQGYAANPAPKHPVVDKRGRPKQTPARNLLLRLDQNRKQVLAFLYDLSVPFDNNLAERDLRMLKVRQKVSGGFRTLSGAEAFCRVRGYLSTLRKQGKNLLTSLEQVFRGCPEPVVTG